MFQWVGRLPRHTGTFVALFGATAFAVCVAYPAFAPQVETLPGILVGDTVDQVSAEQLQTTIGYDGFGKEVQRCSWSAND